MDEKIAHYLLMISCIISGSAIIILFKLQDLHISKETEFKHYLLQVFFVYLAETTCLVYYYIKKCFRRKQLEQTSFYFSNDSNSCKSNEKSSVTYTSSIIKAPHKYYRNWKSYYFMLPAVLDIFFVTFSLLCLDLFPASCYQMLRSLQYLYVPLFSWIFLNNISFNSRHYVSYGIIFIGLVFIAFTKYFYDTNITLKEERIKAHITIEWYAYAIFSVALVIGTLKSTLRTKLFKKYDIYPLD